jgi:hypothetical protein
MVMTPMASNENAITRMIKIFVMALIQMAEVLGVGLLNQRLHHWQISACYSCLNSFFSREFARNRDDRTTAPVAQAL